MIDLRLGLQDCRLQGGYWVPFAFDPLFLQGVSSPCFTLTTTTVQ